MRDRHLKFHERRDNLPPPAATACPPDAGCDTNAQLELFAQDNSVTGQLRYNLARLKTGSRNLADGNQRLADGVRQLRDGLARATSGSASVAEGQQLLSRWTIVQTPQSAVVRAPIFKARIGRNVGHRSCAVNTRSDVEGSPAAPRDRRRFQMM